MGRPRFGVFVHCCVKLDEQLRCLHSILMQESKTIVVTGCNKGIGLGLVSKLASQANWRVVMACRNNQLAQSACDNIKMSVELLDVSDHSSITQFVTTIKAKYGAVDVLVNNAGVKREKYDIQSFELMFATNFYGTIELSLQMLPLLENSGKVIFVGSRAGRLGNLCSEQVRERFRDPSLDKTKLFGLMSEYRQSVVEGNSNEKGFYKRIYGVSKLGINLFAKVFSKEPAVIEKQIQVYSLCPGHVATDMTEGAGPLTVEEGVQTPLFLINLPFEVNESYQGQHFYGCEVSSLEGEWHMESQKDL